MNVVAGGLEVVASGAEVLAIVSICRESGVYGKCQNRPGFHFR